MSRPGKKEQDLQGAVKLGHKTIEALTRLTEAYAEYSDPDGQDRDKFLNQVVRPIAEAKAATEDFDLPTFMTEEIIYLEGEELLEKCVDTVYDAPMDGASKEEACANFFRMVSLKSIAERLRSTEEGVCEMQTSFFARYFAVINASHIDHDDDQGFKKMLMAIAHPFSAIGENETKPVELLQALCDLPAPNTPVAPAGGVLQADEDDNPFALSQESVPETLLADPADPLRAPQGPQPMEGMTEDDEALFKAVSYTHLTLPTTPYL